ncbi:pentapeptide repeat-containing protein [Phormidium sp. CLA17]|uniref:pentapeptide repeat-containing protein n=1 Tax=Leptolyngbya sp. Cla-17 TaxID=2803751 RepID=UPI0014923B67|nr:pentapeptide repeat-containing protein [Leptolyngbya sp. Cla-17]MBM0740584.1 pentapeptide repeat-containing protein [Leptolyngbya sp. Cla-17]
MTNQNYANQSLQNSSFKGQNLDGADFSRSNLRGCDFTRASLVGATFEGCEMGQSLRQRNSLVIAAVMGPIVLVGFSAIAVHVSDVLFRDHSNPIVNFFLGALPILAFIAHFFLQDKIVFHFPTVVNFLSIIATAGFFAVMVTFTIGLLIVSLFSLSDGSSAQGLLLLLIMVIFAIITFHIFQWLLQSIQSSPGTSFRKANLTNANFSHAKVQNTDFSLALLTGVCIFDWSMNEHTQLTTTQCEYLYLEPEQHNRRPSDRGFRAGELNCLLTQFIK